MRIKSYFAPSVQSAISLARKEFGEGVTLVTSHVAAAESRDLGEYEVVFAIEESSDSAAPEQAVPVPGQMQDKFQEVLAQAIAAPASPQLNLPEKLEQLRSLFVEIGIDPTMVRALMTMVERCVPVPQLPAAETDALLTASRVPAPAANAQAASLTVPVLSAAASGPAADPKEESPSPAAKPKHSAAELAFLTSVSEPSKTPPPSLPDWRFGL